MRPQPIYEGAVKGFTALALATFMLWLGVGPIVAIGTWLAVVAG